MKALDIHDGMNQKLSIPATQYNWNWILKNEWILIKLYLVEKNELTGKVEFNVHLLSHSHVRI